MNNISKETRQVSFMDIQDKAKGRYEQILNRLGDREMTAKEIAVEMFELEMIPSSERNYAAARLTELEKLHLVKVVGKKQCKWSGKMVSAYRRTTPEEKMMLDNMQHIPNLY